MDFTEILKPYQEEGTVRDYAAYIKWLTGPKYGIPREFAEKAILKTFTELSQGKDFAPSAQFSAGHFLDQYIRDLAIKYRDDWAAEEQTKMESFFSELIDTHKERWEEEYKKAREGTVWGRIKAVFKP